MIDVPGKSIIEERKVQVLSLRTTYYIIESVTLAVVFSGRDIHTVMVVLSADLSEAASSLLFKKAPSR